MIDPTVYYKLLNPQSYKELIKKQKRVALTRVHLDDIANKIKEFISAEDYASMVKASDVLKSFRIDVINAKDKRKREEDILSSPNACRKRSA